MSQLFYLQLAMCCCLVLYDEVPCTAPTCIRFYQRNQLQIHIVNRSNSTMFLSGLAWRYLIMHIYNDKQ